MTPMEGILSAKLPYKGLDSDSDSVVVGNETHLFVCHGGQVHLSTSVSPLA